MPRFFIARKSGVHRVACFALYRALLSANNNAILQNQIRKRFRKCIKIQSPRDIVAALTFGYETLHKLLTKPEDVLTRISALQASKEPEHKQKPRPSSLSQPKPQYQVSEPPNVQSSSTPYEKIGDPRRVWPHPAATPLLSSNDPLPVPPNCRRRIPYLVHAGGIPMLRFKKPQSPFLSHMIRRKILAREKRVDRIQTLDLALATTSQEDEWDRLLWEICGLPQWDRDVKWKEVVEQELQKMWRVHWEIGERRKNIVKKMEEVIDREKGLVEKEKKKKRDERHRRYKERRRAREEAAAAAVATNATATT
ncbi:MAG: hypothetical protein LQ342_002276 [Letrouitia transgressa]|nr:MAG: hypothetical protein LQ342_002276 [Letrouitia transgressa]